MRVALLLATVALAACSDEPDFDERYDAAKQRIEASAAEMDEELQKRRKEAAPGDVAPSGDEAGKGD